MTESTDKVPSLMCIRDRRDLPAVLNFSLNDIFIIDMDGVPIARVSITSIGIVIGMFALRNEMYQFKYDCKINIFSW